MPQRRDAVTIADVARSVGVATSTVSRALNQPGRISDELRDRIVAAATALGYHPNPQARSLTSGRTQSVALLVPDITNPFFFGLIRGAQAQARARGHRHVLVDTEESAEVEALTLAELPSSVDGIVLAAARLTDAELTAAAGRVPLVLVNREVPGLRSVVMDTAAGVLQALDHLVSLGHRSVAYLAGPATSWSGRKRWRALQRAARRLNVDCVRVGPFPPTMAAGAAAADAAVHHRVTGCLFFNDLLAIGALRRFAERGIRVPDDLSVVGCDDIFGADFCRPPLTTVTTPVEQTGRVAVDMLLSTPVAGAPVRPGQTLPTHLTIRASTGPVPTRRAGGS